MRVATLGGSLKRVHVETTEFLKVPELGWDPLGKTKASSLPQTLLKNRLVSYGERGFLGYEDEASWVACIIALSALEDGNYGIGALIVDDDSNVLTYGYNRGCSPTFRSDAHAEMVTISNFEARFPNQKKDGLTLYTSLEPCPMCYTRILISGIPRVVYVADDDGGGMVQRKDSMPGYWRAMESRCVFSRAVVGEELRRLSWDILLFDMDDLGRRVQLSARSPQN
jgi:tRNA(adenine34) deaminase